MTLYKFNEYRSGIPRLLILLVEEGLQKLRTHSVQIRTESSKGLVYLKAEIISKTKTLVGFINTEVRKRKDTPHGLRTLKKVSLMAVVCLVTETTYALQFEVVGPCDPKPRLEVYVDIKNKITVGDLTVNLLNANRIPFKGDAAGIAQIENSPIGRDAIEVLNPNKYRAYGWCIHIDGFEPGDMPDQINITESTKKISWFYAFSLFDNGEWKNYCTPSWQVHSLAICNLK